MTHSPPAPSLPPSRIDASTNARTPGTPSFPQSLIPSPPPSPALSLPLPPSSSGATDLSSNDAIDEFVEHIFAAIDTDGDGVVTASELFHCLDRLGQVRLQHKALF